MGKRAKENIQAEAEAKASKVVVRDRHALYEAAVQSVDVEVDFLLETYRGRHGRLPATLREDFCGTAALACEWVRRDPKAKAWGVDLDAETLAWGQRNNLSRLAGEAQQRLVLLNQDVRAATAPAVDVVAAFNFSYWVFHQRADLVSYFRQARAGLAPGGMLVLDAFGGTDAMGEIEEERRVKGKQMPDGTPMAAFTYVWEQALFNPVDHHLVCHIHFDLKGGERLQRAFTYDWRFYTLPELTDALREAGFASVDVYADGWDEEAEEGDGVYVKSVSFENWPGWLTYIVASV